MNPVANRPNESFKALQVAATIRNASVDVVDPTPNLVSQIIKSGSPKPHATVSNAMVARVDSYTPPPGRNMAHYVALDVDKADNSTVGVTDAMQRYLGVAPTRKPGGDPKNVSSLDSHPMLVIDEDKQWADPHPYKFSVNGVVQRQVQPTFYTLGGSMAIRVVGTGVTAITTPETKGEPSLQVGPLPAGAYYPPAVAAQLAMRRITDLYDDSGRMEVQKVGPDVNRSPSETLSSVSDALAVINSTPAISSSVKAGMNNFANMGIYSQSPQLYLTAVALRT